MLRSMIRFKVMATTRAEDAATMIKRMTRRDGNSGLSGNEAFSAMITPANKSGIEKSVCSSLIKLVYFFSNGMRDGVSEINRKESQAQTMYRKGKSGFANILGE